MQMCAADLLVREPAPHDAQVCLIERRAIQPGGGAEVAVAVRKPRPRFKSPPQGVDQRSGGFVQSLKFTGIGIEHASRLDVRSQRLHVVEDEIGGGLHQGGVPRPPDQRRPVAVELPWSVENAERPRFRRGREEGEEASSLLSGATDRRRPDQRNLVAGVNVCRILNCERIRDLDLAAEDAPALRRLRAVGKIFDDDGAVLIRPAPEVAFKIRSLQHEFDVYRQEQKELSRKVPHLAHHTRARFGCLELSEDDGGRPVEPVSALHLRQTFLPWAGSSQSQTGRRLIFPQAQQATDPRAAGGRIEEQADAPAQDGDVASQLEQGFEPQSEATDLAAAFARRIGVQKGEDARLIDRFACVGRPEAKGVHEHDDTARRRTALDDRISGVLNQFGDLTVGVSAGEDGFLDVGVLTGVMRRGLVGLKTIVAELFRIARQGCALVRDDFHS
ncbi:hypothetical protein D3C72_777970 [compost metagenome]